MNLANKITLFRVFMIPVFLVVLLTSIFDDPLRRYIAVGIFVIASLSDLLDGYIARSRNLVTNFGKFADPLADKLLVSAALISLVELKQVAAWAVVLIISREFIITGLRQIALLDNKVLAAGNSGKLKTASQMVMITYMLFGFTGDTLMLIGNILIIIAVVLTVYSGVEYIVKNLSVFKD